MLRRLLALILTALANRQRQAPPPPRVEVDVDIILITDEAARAEIKEAITHLATTAARLPDHYDVRKAALHAQIDALLEVLESLSD